MVIGINKKSKKDVKVLNKGITLIALIITIIILLILAGVTIAMLTGENGILNKANNAKTETVKKGAVEKVNLAIAGSFDNSEKTVDELLKTNLGNVEGIDKTTIPNLMIYPLTVKVDGVKIIITKDDVTKIAKAEEKPESKNTEYKDSKGKTAIIPKEFKVSTKSGETEIDTGLVVIAPDDSEFVWIPVDKTTLCVDGTSGKEIAEIATGSDYRGQLYDFSGSGDATISTKKTYDSSGFREPDVLIDATYADGNKTYLEAMNSILGTSFNVADDFKKYMQTEYNEIIGSIKINGGYYVGRYESSITGSTEGEATATGDIQSKKGVMPTSANNSGIYRWYGLYSKQKVYSKTEKIKETGIKSAMIYGSMYDGMLNFALKGADKNKITANSTMHGPEKTGNVETDKINNVYDLGNNLFEWTSEANYTYYRTVRRRQLWEYQSSKQS